MSVGAPRTHDREEVRNKMIEWALEEESLNLNGFCRRVMISPQCILRWAKEEELFGSTYNLVRSILGDRRERALKEGNLHVKAYDLNATTYDAFLKEEKKEMMEYEYKLKALETLKVSEVDLARHDEVMKTLGKLQKPASEE